jgi:hypothetical protein
VPSSDHDIASTNQDKIIGLRANAFAAVVMLLIELGLGVGVNLYSNLPASDHGKGLLTAFGAAVTGGPVALTLHALLGTLLLITGIAAVVRATLARRTLLICIAILAFVAILVAWVTGTEFVGDMSNGKSLVMAVATALAILCYATLLFIAPTPRSSSRR